MSDEIQNRKRFEIYSVYERPDSPSYTNIECYTDDITDALKMMEDVFRRNKDDPEFTASSICDTTDYRRIAYMAKNEDGTVSKEARFPSNVTIDEATEILVKAMMDKYTIYKEE